MLLGWSIIHEELDLVLVEASGDIGSNMLDDIDVWDIVVDERDGHHHRRASQAGHAMHRDGTPRRRGRRGRRRTEDLMNELAPLLKDLGRRSLPVVEIHVVDRDSIRSQQILVVSGLANTDDMFYIVFFELEDVLLN